MDLNTILISSAITSSVYGVYKGGIHIYKNYYLKSECHDNQLMIEIVTHKPPEEEEKKEAIVEAVVTPSPTLPQV